MADGPAPGGRHHGRARSRFANAQPGDAPTAPTDSGDPAAAAAGHYANARPAGGHANRANRAGSAISGGTANCHIAAEFTGYDSARTSARTSGAPECRENTLPGRGSGFAGGGKTRSGQTGRMAAAKPERPGKDSRLCQRIGQGGKSGATNLATKDAGGAEISGRQWRSEHKNERSRDGRQNRGITAGQGRGFNTALLTGPGTRRKTREAT